jgi:NAD+ synthase (glutamine-hydrolysing)
MGHLITVAACQLNQWAMDFDGNLRRIKESIRIAKEKGAKLRVGPELECTGYGAYDHFLENDTYDYCWRMIHDILSDRSCDDILLDVGSPILHRQVRYNCRIICLNGKILFIRPKLYLADDGQYRESRYFTPWARHNYCEEFYLPQSIQKVQGSLKVPFGDAIVSTPDTCFAAETCEELFTPQVRISIKSIGGQVSWLKFMRRTHTKFRPPLLATSRESTPETSSLLKMHSKNIE